MNYDYMSAQFNKDDKSYLIGVKVQKDIGHENSDEIVQFAVSKLISEENISDIKVVNVKKDAQGEILVNFGDIEIKFTRPDSETIRDNAGADLKIIHIAEQKLPRRRRTINEIERSLYDKWPEAKPVAVMLLSLVVVPLARLISLFRPGMIFDTASMKWQEDPTGAGAVRSAMGEVIVLLKQDKDPNSQKVIDSFEKGLNFVNDWKTGNKVDAINKVFDSLEDGVSIPGGYWSEGEFNPVQWTFYSDADGKLCVNQLGYGKEDGQKLQSFVFEPHVDDEKVKMMLDNLMKLSEPAATTPAPKPGVIISAAYAVMAMKDKEVQAGTEAKPEVEGSKSSLDYMHSLFHEGGGTALPAENFPKTKPILSTNPLKLLQETIRTQFPEANLQDKALFSMHFLYNRMTKILIALPEMNQKDRSYWLHKLEKDYSSLQNRLEKNNLPNEILQSLDVFSGKINEFKSALGKLQADELKLSQKRMKNLDSVSQEKIQAQVKTDFKKSTDAAATKQQGRISAADRANLTVLHDAFDTVTDNIQKVEDTLATLTDSVDAYVEAGNYEAAIELSREMMPLIPPPDTLFWRYLQGNGTGEQAKGISDSIGKLSQYFWESKVKTNNMLLKPDEIVYMINIQSAFNELILAREVILKRKSESDWTIEEETFMAALYEPDDHYVRSYDDDPIGKEINVQVRNKNFGIDKLYDFDEHKQHIRPGENSQLGDIIVKNEEYVKNSRLIQINSRNANEAILKSFGIDTTLINDPDDDKNYQELMFGYFSREIPSDPNKPFIPSQFGDALRHQIMFNSMCKPESRISPYAFAAKVFPRYVKKVLSPRYHKTNKENFKEAMNAIGKYERLEITCMHQGKIAILDVSSQLNFGIVPRGHKPGEKPYIEISSNVTKLSLYSGETESLHEEAVGNPGEVYGSHLEEDALMSYANSEATTLYKALASESPTPLDDYVLAVMDGHGNIQNDTHSNIYDVFDAILQSPWLLNYKGKNSQDIEGLEAQRRIYGVLFQPGLIEKAARDNPDFFKYHAEPLRHLLGRLHDQGDAASFSFLLYLCETVRGHLETQDLEADILDKWPGATEFGEKAYKLWEGEKSFQQKVDGAANFVAMFSNSADAMNKDSPGGLTGASDKEIAHLLKMGSLLEQVKSAGTMPVIGQQAQLWIKEYLVPFIEGLPDAERNKILNEWLESVGGSGWTAVAGQLQVWEKREAGGVSRVDLATQQILMKNGVANEGTEVRLASDIRGNLDYKAAFGDANFDAKVRPGRIPGQFVYTFADDKGKNYRITLNKADGKISIERKERNVWFQYCSSSVGEKEPVGLDALLVKGGVWVNVDNRSQGFAFLGKNALTAADEDKYVVSMDRSGRIKKITSNSGLEVVNDAKQKLSKVISCIPEEQIIFLKKPGKKALSEIHFLNQKNYLVRDQASGKWQLKGDEQLDGAEWIMGENNFLKSFGGNIEQTGFTVRQGNDTYFITWPHQAALKGAGKSAELTFLKEEHLEAPLKVKIEEGGEVKSSAGGHLQLAYLFAAKHDYVQAASYLQRACETKIETKAELDQIFMLEQFFQKMSVTSVRSSIIKLKGLLSARQILQEQTKNLQYTPEKWNEFLGTAQDIHKTYATYLDQLKNSSYKSYEAFLKSEGSQVSFTSEELSELEHSLNESLAFGISEGEVAVSELKIGVPSASQVKDFVPIFLAKMASPMKKADDLINNISLDPKLVVGNFFELYNLIIAEKLNLENLQALFAPNSDPEIDTARRLLINAAADMKDGNLREAVDLKNLQKLKKEMPESKISMGFKMIKNWWVGRKAEKEKDPVKKAAILAGSKKEKFANALIDVCNRVAGDLQGNAVTLKGFANENEEVVPAALKQGKGLYLENIEAALKKDPNLFGLGGYEPILEVLQNQELFADFQGKPIPAEKLIAIVKDKTQINLMEALREVEVKKRIDNLEQKIEQTVKKTIDFTLSEEPELVDSKLPESFVDLWSPVDNQNLQNNLGELQADLGGVIAGVNEVKLNDRFNINPNNLDALFTDVESCRTDSSSNMKEMKDEILQYLKDPENRDKFPFNVRKALSHAEKIGDDAILHELKKAYQNSELNDQYAVELLTDYLLHKAAVGVMSSDRFKDQLQTLKALKAEGADGTSDEWISAATLIHNLMTQSMNYGRNQIENVSLYRKILLAEATQGIVLTNEQIELIKKIVINPCNWYELKVGLGKTSVVFPIVLMLLIEQGEFPAAMVKDELLQQNLDSLDRSTRELLEQAGVEFAFQINDSISPVLLQEQYLRLLEVQARKGYPITSINSVIAIDQKIQLLNESLNEILNKPEPEKHVKEIEVIQKNIYYLGKIKEKLNFVLIDEADDVLNVIAENNVGRGNPTTLNNTIQDTMVHIMGVVHTSDNEDIELLRTNLQRGAPITSKVSKEQILPALVRELLKSPDFLNYLNIQGLENIGVDNLTHYLTTVFEGENPPAIPGQSKTTQEKLGALKKIIQTTLPTALMQNPGIDTGLKKSDGYQIGPQVSGREKQGTVFSDEHDLIVNHYLYYSMKLPEPLNLQSPEDSFVMKGLKQIRDQHPLVYEEWVNKAGDQDIITFFNEEENYAERMKFLQLHVIAEMKIKRYTRQIVFNVQDICQGRRVGGMTGTLNRDALPETGVSQVQSKKGTAQVILEAGMLKIPDVDVVEEADVLSKMIDVAKDINNKAVINQGFDIEKGSARAVVEKLREGAPQRIYIFVDTDSRKTFIWKPDDSEPKPVSKRELNQLVSDKNFKQNACFYFGPPDTRGTDFRIPPGKGVTFLSAKCSMDDFIQTLGRMRGAGTIHSMDFVIPTAVQERIGDEPSYASIVKDIDDQNNQEMKGKNLKAGIESMKTVVKMQTRVIIYGRQAVSDESPEVKMINTEINKILSNAANDPKTGWLEEVKSTNLQNDFAPTVMEQTKDSLDKIYRTEKEKISRFQDAFNDIANSPMMKLADNPETIQWMQTRANEIQEQIDLMKTELTSAYRVVLKKLESNIYPAKGPSSGAGIPNSQAQVQEVAQAQQVQQQQQQQQQQVNQLQAKKVDNVISVSTRNYIAVNAAPWLMTIINKGRFKINIINVKLSENFHFIYDALEGIKGHQQLCRLAVDKDDNVCIITRQDIALVGNGAGLEWKAVYALTNEAVCGTREICDFGDERAKDGVLHAFVKAKWFLGISEYSNQEKVLLKEWLKDRAHMPKSGVGERDIVDGAKFNDSLFCVPETLATIESFMANVATPEQKTLYAELMA